MTGASQIKILLAKYAFFLLNVAILKLVKYLKNCSDLNVQTKM